MCPDPTRRLTAEWPFSYEHTAMFSFGADKGQPDSCVLYDCTRRLLRWQRPFRYEPLSATARHRAL
jgi:hypothetical protein